MAPPIVGKYELVEGDTANFDKYMTAVGVSFFTRQAARLLKPSTIISKEGDEFNIETKSTLKNSSLKFKIGEEFQEETADGRKCLSTVTMEGDSRMKHVQKCDKLDLVMYRDFTDDEMKVTLNAPEVQCIRIYKKVE